MSRRSTTGSEPGSAVQRACGRSVTRRDFVRLLSMAGGCAATSLLLSRAGMAIGPGRPDFHGADTIFRGEYPLDTAEAIVLSTCLGCHGACPVRLALDTGILAKIDGNPWSPRVFEGFEPTCADQAARLRGALCARGQARLQNTYDPFRIVRPIKRVGARGEGRWQSVEAAALLDDLSIALQGVSVGGLVIAGDPRQQDRRAILAGFAQAVPDATVHLGSPFPWLVQASEAMLGQPGWAFLPRMDQARGLLLWGADAVASGVDPVGDAMSISRLRTNHRPGPLVVVDPRLSDAAGLADVWLPVRPGGDAALAWMMLRAWYEDGLIEPAGEWMEQALAWPWAALEQRSGLGQAVVRRTSSLLAELGSGLAVRIGGGVGERPDGADATEAILRLAVLAGAAGAGGAMEPTPLPPVLGERPDLALLSRLEEQGPIDMLVVIGDAGLIDSPHQSAILAALSDPERVRSLVAVTPTINPVAQLADMLLPDLTEHERHGLVERFDGNSLVQPAVPSMLAEAGLEAPLVRGLDGLLEQLSQRANSRLDCVATLEQAIDSTGQAELLRRTGWSPTAEQTSAAPKPSPFRVDAARSPSAPPEGLCLVTYRESFGGFHESLAQYWATPTLRRTNRAWVHPATAASLELEEGARARIVAGERQLLVELEVTEAIRPGAVALAVGYGHRDGFDGQTTLDGVAVPVDERRILGSDTGSLRSPAGLVEITPAPPVSHPTILDLLTAPSGQCERI